MRRLILVALFIPWLIGCESGNVRDYAHAPDAVVSQTFEVFAEGRPILVEEFKDVDYVHIEINKPVEITVRYKEDVQSFSISPLHRQIEGKPVNDRKLSFRIPSPGYYVVTINEGRKLFVLADQPLEKEMMGRDSNMIFAEKYVSDQTGTVVQTAQLQKALDEASGSGKILYFSPGIYRTGMLKVHSNTNIYLEAGAMIKGSESREDYPSDEGRPESDHVNNKENYTDYGEWMTFSRLIFIDNAENVSITGRGIIDGSGNIVRAQGKPANLIRIRNSRNVTIDGVILRDPAAWNTHILYSSDVHIRNVKVLNDFDVANTDGFDPDASKNVFIENCFAYCNDDNIAIKTTNNGNYLQDLENIQIRGCVFITKKSSLKVGTETKAGLMENILFEDNDVLESDRGMALYCNDGATFRNIRFVNNRFEKSFHKGRRCGMQFFITDRYGKGQIEDVLIENCTFFEAFPKKSEIFGLNEDHRISGLKIKNLVIAGKVMESLSEAGIVTNDFVDNITLEP